MRPFNLFRWSMILSILLLTLAASTLVLAQEPAPAGCTVSVQASAGMDWPHFGYDSSFTAYNPLESTISVSSISQLKRKWGIDCGGNGCYGSISQSPAIYDGKLFSTGSPTTTLNLLTAYDARTGRKLWEFGGKHPYGPQPVVSQDGIVFYFEDSNPSELYAVDADDGHQLWKFFIDLELGFTEEALVTVDEALGRIYFVEMPSSGNGGKLWAANRQNGGVAWYKSKDEGDYDFRGHHVLLDGGKIYAVAQVPDAQVPHTPRDHMLRIDTSSQVIETIYDRPQPEGYYDIEQYTLCNDKLVVGFSDQYDPTKLLVAYNPISSTIVWTEPFSEITGALACNTAKNRVYVPTNPHLYALDATTGNQVWKYSGYGAIRNPSVANGIIYFLSLTNMVAIDEETRQKVFSYPMGQTASETSQVAIADGMLYFSPGRTASTCGLFALGWPDQLFLPVIVRGG